MTDNAVHTVDALGNVVRPGDWIVDIHADPKSMSSQKRVLFSVLSEIHPDCACRCGDGQGNHGTVPGVEDCDCLLVTAPVLESCPRRIKNGNDVLWLHGLREYIGKAEELKVKRTDQFLAVPSLPVVGGFKPVGNERPWAGSDTGAALFGDVTGSRLQVGDVVFPCRGAMSDFCPESACVVVGFTAKRVKVRNVVSGKVSSQVGYCLLSVGGLNVCGVPVGGADVVA